MDSKRKKFILEQFTCCYNKEGWFVPLTKALAGLTNKDFEWKENINLHSIRELVDHLIFWNERYLMRFKGIKPERYSKQNEATFSENSKSSKKELIEKLCSIMDDWIVQLKKCDDKKLDGRAFIDYPKAKDKWWEVLAQITIHNAYHAGQIMLIRKKLKH